MTDPGERERPGTSEELFNLLINPLHHDFALRWHRDDVRENATEEEEAKALAAWTHGVSPADPPPPARTPTENSL